MLPVRRVTLKTVRALIRCAKKSTNLPTDGISLESLKKAKELLVKNEQLPRRFKVIIVTFGSGKENKIFLTKTLPRAKSLNWMVKSAEVLFKRKTREKFVPVGAIFIWAVFPGRVYIELPKWPWDGYFTKKSRGRRSLPVY
ncbi:MAG: hypothetical protein Q7R98_00840 [Candidatus Jorgensenbacteria bacterium]|nr:hypothetical protein [Candidatus Jorgensenbacteria bacterium]